jgi:hypothetical protein
MTLRDQLDQIARLEEKRADTGLPFDERVKASHDFREALVNFWRSGGRDLAEDGMRLIWFLSRRDSTDGIVKMMLRQIEGDYPSMDEWRTAIDAARKEHGD